VRRDLLRSDAADAEPVEGLAEEAAHRSGEGDVEDLGVGQPEGAQPVHVGLRRRRGVEGDLARELDDRGVDSVQLGSRGAVVADDRSNALRTQEPVEQHGAMRKAAVAGPQTTGGGERGELAPSSRAL
jgi:hypothetical protein